MNVGCLRALTVLALTIFVQGCSFTPICPPARLDMAPVDLPKDSRVRVEVGLGGVGGLFSASLAGATLRAEQGLPFGSFGLRMGRYSLNPGEKFLIRNVSDTIEDFSVSSIGTGVRLGNKEGRARFTVGGGADYVHTKYIDGWSYSMELGAALYGKAPKWDRYGFFVAYRMEAVVPEGRHVIRSNTNGDWIEPFTISESPESSTSYEQDVLQKSTIHQIVVGAVMNIDPFNELYYSIGYGQARAPSPDVGYENYGYVATVFGFGGGLRHSF